MNKIDLSNKVVLISRTDSIGDVVLSLPICGWIKEQFPTAKIIFIGKGYTVDVLRCYPAIDQIVTLENITESASPVHFLEELKGDVFIHVFPNKYLAKIAKKARIPFRIGTSHRLFHWLTCSHQLNFTRKKSELHESQLNFELLRPLGLNHIPKMETINQYIATFHAKSDISTFLQQYADRKEQKIILHCRSKGSAVEWPLHKYVQLAEELATNGALVFFSGTEEEGVSFRNLLPNHPSIIDLSGQSTLAELITFISLCDALVACSTGPLHISGALNRKTIGLFANLRPMHPGRWSPLGRMSTTLVANSTDPNLSDIGKITVNQVIEKL